MSTPLSPNVEARRQAWLKLVDAWGARHGMTRLQVISSQFCDNTIDGPYDKDLHAWVAAGMFAEVTLAEAGLKWGPIGRSGDARHTPPLAAPLSPAKLMLRAMLAGHEVQIGGVFYSLSPQGDNICTREPANSCLDPDVNYILDTPFNTIARKATRMTDGERHRLETLLGLPVSPVPSLVPGDDEEAPVP